MTTGDRNWVEWHCMVGGTRGPLTAWRTQEEELFAWAVAMRARTEMVRVRTEKVSDFLRRHGVSTSRHARRDKRTGRFVPR